MCRLPLMTVELQVGVGATVILQPRYDDRTLAFAVDMEPGDIYLISGGPFIVA